MSNEFAPKEGKVEQIINRGRVDTYRAEAGSALHTDGDLLNQPPIAAQRVPDAGDHQMTKEDGEGFEEEVPEFYRH